MSKTSERYLEDFAAGQKFGSRRLDVERERIKSCAGEIGPRSLMDGYLIVPRRPA